MASGIRTRLTYANVMASIAVFVALGGGAYAAITLPANSVGAKQLKKGAVKSTKLAKNAVSGTKVKNRSLTGADINPTKLGKVPNAATADRAISAATADRATTADSIAAPEAYHEVGAPGEPQFAPGAGNFPSPAPDVVNFETAGFYKDREGVVRLKGLVTVGTGQVIFLLPPGYRPADRKLIELVASCRDCQSGSSGGDSVPVASTTVQIFGGGVGAGFDGQVLAGSAPSGGSVVSLDGLTFRAGG